MKSVLPKILLLGGIGYAAYYLLTQSRRFDVGSAYVSGISIAGGGVKLNVKVPILNRSDLALRITGFLGQLRYKGSAVSDIELAQETEIESFKKSDVEFTTIITASSVGMEIFNAFLQNVGTGKDIKDIVKWSDFDIVGTIKFPGGAIDIEENVF